MMTRSAFHPNPSNLARLMSVPSQDVFGAESDSSLRGVFFLRDSAGEQFAISWSYGDVQFKFEMYFLEVRDDLNAHTNVLRQITKIPAYEHAVCFFRSEWIRPAKSGEVPEGYELIVEERGPIAAIPLSAIAAGTSLFGIGFSDVNGSLLLGFAVDESESYCLRVVDSKNELETAFQDCDRVLASDVELWLHSQRRE